jgi:hypothetical protein
MLNEQLPSFVPFRQIDALVRRSIDKWKQFKFLGFFLSCALTWLIAVGHFVFGISTEHQSRTTRISMA